MTTGQAKKLKLKKGSRWSPYLEKCCLLVSANESYQRASEDIETLTGIKISRAYPAKNSRATGMGGNNPQRANQRNQLGWRNGEVTHPIRTGK